jgi:8-oxo-dGTP pyrophosphatase MutT (NUDIX family)
MAVDPVLWLDGINTSMTFRPADALVMSCGTVTLDLERGQVLLIWNKHLQIHQLPKGRRNIEEPMLSAAIRETFEETGIHVTPLPLKIATRATLPSVEGAGPQTNPQITEGRHSTEFLGCCLYPDPQSDTPALKSVFYFAATADSTVAPEQGTQEAWEKLETRWVPVDEAATYLRFQGEIDAVKKAVGDTEKTGLSIGGRTAIGG